MLPTEFACDAAFNDCTYTNLPKDMQVVCPAIDTEYLLIVDTSPVYSAEAGDSNSSGKSSSIFDADVL